MVQLIQILDIGKMKNRFKIYSYSKKVGALLLIFSCFAIVFLTLLGGKIFGEPGLSIGGCLGLSLMMVNTFITPKYLAKFELEIYCDTNSLEITNIKPYFEKKVGKMISIKYDDLKSYKFEVSNYFSTFKLFLKDGTTVKFHRWYNDNDDQFDDFYEVFKKNIKINNANRNSSNRVAVKKSLFENRPFLIAMAIVIILFILVTMLLLFKKGVLNREGFVYIFIFLSPLVWVSSKIIKGLKK